MSNDSEKRVRPDSGQDVQRRHFLGWQCRIPCAVHDLEENDPAWQATFWHNTMFNPNIPGGIRILAFTPDWAAAEADPPAV